MLFQQILSDKAEHLLPEFNQLLNEIYKNQTHGGDLLLVSEHGHYYPEAEKWDNGDTKSSAYMVGPGDIGHSQSLHHNFIGTYLRKHLSVESYDEYLAKFKWSEDRVVEIEQLQMDDFYGVQEEMLIYQKIWEMDLYIKYWYQLTRLVYGEDYNWHFEIHQNKRNDKGKKRHVIIRELVRDRLQTKYPKIYAAINTAYKSQVRNSIAHSKYSFLGRYIHLNNYIEGEEGSEIEVVTFEEWADMIHTTIVLYNMVNIILNRADEAYFQFYNNEMPEGVQIRINKKHPQPATVYQNMKPRGGPGDGWYPVRSDNQ